MAWWSGVRRPTRPDPEPLETGGIPMVGLGTALWAVGFVVLLVARVGGADVRGWWLTMCAYGVALGLLGLLALTRRQRQRQRPRP